MKDYIYAIGEAIRLIVICLAVITASYFVVRLFANWPQY